MAEGGNLPTKLLSCVIETKQCACIVTEREEKPYRSVCTQYFCAYKIIINNQTNFSLIGHHQCQCMLNYNFKFLS